MQQDDEEEEIRKAIELSKQTALLEEKRRAKEAKEALKNQNKAKEQAQKEFDFGAKGSQKVDDFDFGAFMGSNPGSKSEE